MTEHGGATGQVNKQFLTFLVVGGLNTLFGYSVFAALVFFKIDPALALLLATVAGVLFNFKTTGALVFANRDNRLLLKFVLVYGLIYAVHLGGLKGLLHLGLNVYVASGLLLVPIALLSFTLNRTLVFVRQP